MRPWLVPVLATLVVGVGAGGVGGYFVGQKTDVSALTGSCRVGDHEASCVVDGWTYGINDSVPWLDAGNSYHESGWPACLAPVGSLATVRFGYTTVEEFNIAWREVVWVSCTT